MKSAAFPAIGRATAAYHVVGAEILGQAILGGERVISIDDLLISDVFIPVIDEAMAHFEYRREYSKQSGEALARTFDRNVAQVMVLAARATATVTGGNGGTRVIDADADTNADSLVDSIFDAVQALDEKDVPDTDRTLFVRPAQYNNLVSSTSKAVHRDYGGSGSVSKGEITSIAGLPVIKTNNLPSTNVTTGPTAYQGDFSQTVAVVSNRSSVGTVKLIDLAVESQYDIRRQGTLLVAKYALGHGILRPECAVEIAKA